MSNYHLHKPSQISQEPKPHVAASLQDHRKASHSHRCDDALRRHTDQPSAAPTHPQQALPAVGIGHVRLAKATVGTPQPQHGARLQRGRSFGGADPAVGKDSVRVKWQWVKTTKNRPVDLEKATWSTRAPDFTPRDSESNSLLKPTLEPSSMFQEEEPCSSNCSTSQPAQRKMPVVQHIFTPRVKESTQTKKCLGFKPKFKGGNDTRRKVTAIGLPPFDNGGRNRFIPKWISESFMPSYPTNMHNKKVSKAYSTLAG